jgi:hypothetical protein
VFKNPIGIFGSFNAGQGHDPQMQHMRMPMYNDYGSQLPPQQAAAAAQHPMLAPRPVDPAIMGYHSFPTQISPPDQTQPQQINAPQFFYPTAPVPPPTNVWHTQSMGQPDNEPTQPVVNDYSQVQQPVYSAQSNMATMQTSPQITSLIGQTAEDDASNLSPVPALNPVLGSMDRDIDPTPQVCKYHSLYVSSCWCADHKYLNDPAPADDISLSTTARAITATITIS